MNLTRRNFVFLFFGASIALILFYQLFTYRDRVLIRPHFDSNATVEISDVGRISRPGMIHTEKYAETPELNGHVDSSVRNKTRIDLFMAVVTAPKRVDRRMATRETWLTTLPSYPGIVMRFFTDGKELEDSVISSLTKEREKFGDLEFMPLRGGVFLTHRILWSLFWAYEHYDFSFFLKTDDDYFVCLNHLNNDIQLRKQETYLSWGWLHCESKQIWIDEGLVILSKDLVDEIIKRNQSLICHPFGDQALAMWLNDIEKEGKSITYFADNGRLIHILGHLRQEDKNENLCSKFLGIHQAYPKYMREYWKLSSSTWHNVTFPKVVRRQFNEYCSQPKGSFDWRLFGSEWRHEPKPCWARDSSWPYLDKAKVYIGREGS